MFRRRTEQRVLAVASGGGHWVQLLRLRPALEGLDTAFVTVRPEYRQDVPDARFYCVNDATAWNRLALVALAVRLFVVLLRERPDVVVSTGAAPGLIAVGLAHFFGARTVWIDSIANVEELSRSGRMAGRVADLWLTQWPHLATEGGPAYAGQVL